MLLSTSQAASLLREEDNSFSYKGSTAMIEYLEALEKDGGEEIEFDATGIGCDYAEHSSLTEWAQNYFGKPNWRDEIGVDDETGDDETDDAIRDYISNRGDLIEFDGGIIVGTF